MIARLALLACLAAPAAAQDAPDAVLKIGRAPDAAGCTAFLIAPDAALTAAHCAARAPVALHAGWRAGRATLIRTGRDPRRPALAPRSENRYRADQVRLTLDRPFEGVAPLVPGPPPGIGSRVAIPAYPRGAIRRETVTCAVADRPGTEIVLDCPARTGMSGAPLLQDGRVVGILTNRIGTDRALATELAPDLLD